MVLLLWYAILLGVHESIGLIGIVLIGRLRLVLLLWLHAGCIGLVLDRWLAWLLPLLLHGLELLLAAELVRGEDVLGQLERLLLGRLRDRVRHRRLGWLLLLLHGENRLLILILDGGLAGRRLLIHRLLWLRCGSLLLEEGGGVAAEPHRPLLLLLHLL